MKKKSVFFMIAIIILVLSYMPSYNANEISFNNIISLKINNGNDLAIISDLCLEERYNTWEDSSYDSICVSFENVGETKISWFNVKGFVFPSLMPKKDWSQSTSLNPGEKQNIDALNAPDLSGIYIIYMSITANKDINIRNGQLFTIARINKKDSTINPIIIF